VALKGTLGQHRHLAPYMPKRRGVSAKFWRFDRQNNKISSTFANEEIVKIFWKTFEPVVDGHLNFTTVRTWVHVTAREGKPNRRHSNKRDISDKKFSMSSTRHLLFQTGTMAWLRSLPSQFVSRMATIPPLLGSRYLMHLWHCVDVLIWHNSGIEIHESRFKKGKWQWIHRNLVELEKSNFKTRAIILTAFQCRSSKSIFQKTNPRFKFAKRRWANARTSDNFWCSHSKWTLSQYRNNRFRFPETNQSRQKMLVAVSLGVKNSRFYENISAWNRFGPFHPTRKIWLWGWQSFLPKRW
jgi:hypothetical protein